jgi:hypothetical protein
MERELKTKSKALSHTEAQGTQRKSSFVPANPADSEALREKLFLCHTGVDGMERELKTKPKSLSHTELSENAEGNE